MDIRIKDRSYWQKVWTRFNAGDREAFEEIYRDFVDVLFDYGAKITNDRDLLKDCIHDLFISLYKYRKNLVNPEYIEFYLLKSLRRNIVRQLKRERNLNPIVEKELIRFNLKFDLEDQIFRKDSADNQLKSLGNILSELDDYKRELLYLKFHSGLNFREIGTILDIKPDTAKKQIYRLLDDLRMKYGEKLLELLYVCYRI